MAEVINQVSDNLWGFGIFSSVVSLIFYVDYIIQTANKSVEFSKYKQMALSLLKAAFIWVHLFVKIQVISLIHVPFIIINKYFQQT